VPAIVPSVIEFLPVLAALVRATILARSDVAAENVLLRHLLAVLIRPTRRRLRLRTRDK